MMRKTVMGVLMAAAVVLASPVVANQMALEYQQGEYSTQGVRVAVQPRGERELSWWGLSWYPEASVSQWNQQLDDRRDRVNVIAFSPVFVRPLRMLGNGELSFEFGIGASVLDERHFGSKNLGTHFQFEDRLGLRWVSPSNNTVTLRYMHYSNGGIGSHNPGVDFINLSYGRPF